MWKSVAESSSNPAQKPSTTNILQKARELYQEYTKNGKWPIFTAGTKDQNSRKRPRTEDLTDVAALLAQNKSFRKDLNKIRSGIKSDKALRPNGSARRGGKYSWDNHYGPDKYFKSKKTFLTWLHRKPNNISNSETKNDVDWWYCTSCERRGNHVVSNCRKSGAIAQAKANKKLEAVNVARVETLPVDSSADDHSESSDDSN